MRPLLLAGDGMLLLPWDDWGPAIAASAQRGGVTDEQAREIDTLARRSDPAPPDRHASRKTILAQFPWAAPPMDAFRA